MNKINWVYYAKNKIIKNDDENSIKQIKEKQLKDVIDAFNKSADKISSINGKKLTSDEVLRELNEIDGYIFEESKEKEHLIKLLEFENDEFYNSYSKLFCIDAINIEKRTILEVEAGRAHDNNQVLKDFLEACVSTKVDYVIIAVRNIYRNKQDYKNINKYFEVFHHARIIDKMGLKGVLIIGY